jgi:hypothetical protein
VRGGRWAGGLRAGDRCVRASGALCGDGKLMFPHPLPLPRDRVLGVVQSGSRGRGGTCGRRLWLARGDLSGLQVDVPPPPAPPPRRGFGCFAGRVSRERGDVRATVVARARRFIRTASCCSPTPCPSPAMGFWVFGGAGLVGEGGWLAGCALAPRRLELAGLCDSFGSARRGRRGSCQERR